MYPLGNLTIKQQKNLKENFLREWYLIKISFLMTKRDTEPISKSITAIKMKLLLEFSLLVPAPPKKVKKMIIKPLFLISVPKTKHLPATGFITV